MTIALLKQRRELNRRKLGVLAFLAKQAEVDEWPERLEALAKKPEALGNEGMIRSVVQEVVQVVATSGSLPKTARAAVATAKRSGGRETAAEATTTEETSAAQDEKANEPD